MVEEMSRYAPSLENEIVIRLIDQSESIELRTFLLAEQVRSGDLASARLITNQECTLK